MVIRYSMGVLHIFRTYIMPLLISYTFITNEYPHRVDMDTFVGNMGKHFTDVYNDNIWESLDSTLVC